MSVSTRAARSSSLRPAVGALTAVATMRQATAAAVTSPKDRATDQKEEEKQPAKQAAAREPAEVLRGAAARIVANMEASLAVPTATSVRTVPARLLEVNRKVINGYLGRTGQGKVSFTHLIGYAVVKAVRDVPVMKDRKSVV